MVTFDIDTDGGVSQDDITKLLEETLKSGNLDGYRVSPDGFDFVKIRGKYIIYCIIWASLREILAKSGKVRHIPICTATETS